MAHSMGKIRIRCTGWLRVIALGSCSVVGLLSVIGFSPFNEEDSWGELNWLGCLAGSRRARSLLKHLLQAEVARNEVLVDHGQKLPRRFHPGQAVIGDLQVRMEVTEVFVLCGEDDLQELHLLDLAEAYDVV